MMQEAGKVGWFRVVVMGGRWGEVLNLCCVVAFLVPLWTTDMFGFIPHLNPTQHNTTQHPTDGVYPILFLH